MKPKLSILCMVLAGAAIWGVASLPLPAQDNNQSEVQRGLDIAPTPLDLKGKNRSSVGLGSYYVNSVSDCVGCHNRPSGGHVGGGVDFGGIFSRNLTPDAAGRPAGLTLSEFIEVMRGGTDFKGIPPNPPGNKLIIMPWEAYRHGTDRYVESIYEYLRSIPCIPGVAGIAATGSVSRCAP